MTIDLSSLPEKLLHFLRLQVAQGGFESQAEYIEFLLQKEAEATMESQSKGDSLRKRELEFQKELVEAGIISQVKLPTPSSEKGRSIPLEIDGPPLSESVIQDRH